MQPAKSVNLVTRISGSHAAMRTVTERDCECAPVKVHAPLLAPPCNDTGREPTQAPIGVQTETDALRASIGDVHCQRDLSRARSRVALPKAAGFVTSSSYLPAQNRTLNTWRLSVQAGGAVSFHYEHGATRKTAPIATSTACLSFSGKTSAIAASFRSTSRAILTCRATARLPQTRRVRPLYSTVSKRMERRPDPTIDAFSGAAA